MTRSEIPGLEAPDPTLEAELRAGLDQAERFLDKTVRADYEMLSEAAAYLLAAGGKRFRPMLVLLAGHFGDSKDARLVPGARRSSSPTWPPCTTTTSSTKPSSATASS